MNTTIESTSQSPTTKHWSIKLQTPQGERLVKAKQLVQATGVGSRFPYIPKVDNKAEAYQGVSMHSQHFRNGSLLGEQGVKVSHSAASDDRAEY